MHLPGYTHIVVAFAVSYTYNAAKNNCNAQCDPGTSVPLCTTQTGNQIDDWQAMGIKVILSFGGAGMGGSWNGDPNNCWDNCFGKEDTVSDALVDIVQSQGFDGVDIDYEYCYDSGGCAQSTSLYSDTAAQYFLEEMTIQLRQKMDAIVPAKDYELTHAPMDSDMVPSSPYFQLLKRQNDKLNYIMPQFYNGYNNLNNGFVGSGAHVVYNDIANIMFPQQPEKVVFGFCIGACGVFNQNGNQAVSVMQEIKTHSGGEYACNGTYLLI